MRNFKTQKAFTLAETLITLVIIGVIAAITVPSLMQNFGNLSNNVALKKNFSVEWLLLLWHIKSEIATGRH